MKLGISGQALGNTLSFHDIVLMGKKYGIDDYEIWPCNSGNTDDYLTSDIAKIKQILKEEGANASCVTLGAAFDLEACKTSNNYAKLLMHAIDAAKELGAPIVNHYCFHISLSDIIDYKRMEEFWLEPLAYARQLGITLVLENEAHDSTRTPENMVKIMEHFNDSYFKTNFDAVNYFHASCEGFPNAYDILRPYIGYVHLKNACIHRPEDNKPIENIGQPMSGLYAPSLIQYAPLPDGSVNIPGLLKQLTENDEYHGVCTLEPHTTPEFVESFYSREISWLRELNFFKK